MTTSNITIETINGIEFKANKKSSNYYIKEDGGKFVRVKVADFNARMDAEKTTEVVEDYSHFILVDLAANVKIEDCESFELSVRRKQYNRNHVYLSESISRKHGVLFTLTKKRANGQRMYRFFGSLENIHRAVVEINTRNNEIKEITNDNLEARKIILADIAKNRKTYQNIDEITTAFVSNRGITTILI